MITSEQIRGARGILGISGRQLAEISGVSYPTIQRVEAQGTSKSAVATIEAIRKALENAGIEFIPENGGGPGVRLKK